MSRSTMTKADGSSKRRRTQKYLLWALLTIAVIAIVVPVSVMFGRRKKSAPKSTILVPLYVYPAPGAWDPLFAAYATNIPLFRADLS